MGVLRLSSRQHLRRQLQQLLRIERSSDIYSGIFHRQKSPLYDESSGIAGSRGSISLANSSRAVVQWSHLRCTLEFAASFTPGRFSRALLRRLRLPAGSVHTIGANTPQTDAQGNYWVFQGFTNGTGQNGTYIPDNGTNVASTVTATFVPGVKVTLITSQPGLQLTIDGRSNYQGYNFVWGQGEIHTISAPATQVDANGRTWTFVSWSNGGAATQTLKVPTTTTNLPLTATFKVQPQVTINSAPAGLQLSVDGTACTTPCVVSRTSGTSMIVAAPASIPSSDVSRMDFTSWSDGTTAPTRTVSFNTDTQAFSVGYHTSWALAANVVPAGTASFTYSPGSPDGFFADGTQVTVTVVPTTGNKFVKWSGDFSGTYTTGYLSMTSPHAITAYTQSVPFIAPAGS